MWTGLTLALFQISGTVQCNIDVLNKSVRTGASSIASSFSILLLIRSGPHALPVTIDFKGLWTSSTVSSIEGRENWIVEVQELEYCCRLAMSEIGSTG